MKVLVHHIYEYKKGLRQLVLHTMSSAERLQAEEKLRHQNIAYFIQEVNSLKINIFFGAKECVNVIRTIENKKLCDFSPEEDFILGSLLGYDKRQQCERYLKKITQIHSPSMRIV